MTDGYKESTGEVWKPEKEGDQIEGLLVKVETGVGTNESMMYHIEDIKSHDIIRVWGTAVLDSRMSGIKEGSQVRITYKGLAEKATKGHKPAKIFKVEYKPDVVKMAENEFEVPAE